jgi:hypothetical protein
MECPYCHKHISLNTQTSQTLPQPTKYEQDPYVAGYMVGWGLCPACGDLIIILYEGNLRRNKTTQYELDEIGASTIVYPIGASRPVEPEVPEKFRKDFIEASTIVKLSPKASAALSRRILQAVLHDHFNIKERDLANEIDKFITTVEMPSYLKETIDVVRQIGNFAAHPMKSKSTGEIIEVEPGEAEWLLDALEALFDFAFVQPKRLEAKRNRLNEKLKDLGKPPMK